MVRTTRPDRMNPDRMNPDRMNKVWREKNGY